MLVGRRREQERIAAALAAARGWRGAALVILGEAGIGKSALLADTIDRADGMLVLAARGVESEAELPFASLHELLRPVLDRLDELPGPQAEALAGALALGPPVPGDRFAVAAGTLSLLGAAAADAPLLLAVDDAHWLDRPSAEALAFSARRLRDEAVAALFAVRTDESSAFDGAGLPVVELGGLEPEAAAELLAARPETIAPPVARQLADVTGGNPLALTEIPAELSPAQLSGAEPLPEPLPAGAGLARAYSRRAAALRPESARALLVAAAEDSAELSVVHDALAALGSGPSALEEAERAGLVRLEGARLEWRHPLVRSAVYHGAEAAARRAVHQALGDASTAPDRRAWHLAAAAEGPDEEVAALLESTAAEARDRRGHAAAAEAFERAARLTADAGERARRLYEAARELWLVGRLHRARTLLADAAGDASTPELEAGILHLRGSIEMWAGDRVEAHALLLAAVDVLEPLDPEAAALVLVDAALAHQMDGDVAATLETSRRAAAVLEGSEAAARIDVEPMLLSARVLAGESRAVDGALMRRLRRYREDGGRAGEDLFLPVWFAHVLTWTDRYDDARLVFAREVEAARVNGSIGLVPFSLACLAEVDFRLGDWRSARARATEAAELARETGQLNLLSFCLVTLARLEAAAGDERAEEHAGEALELAETLGIGSIRVYGLSVRGLLALGLGRLDDAVSALEPLSALVDRLGLREPGVVHWRHDLIEAYALLGRADDGLRELARLDDEARTTGRLWARAVAERCRGMLLPEERAEAAFATALELHQNLPSPFERARTELRLAQRLRRSRRPGSARGLLRRALLEFERLDAPPWADLARRELAAAGERIASRAGGSLEALTPQELRIAELVADGATNRQVATALFVSPKTIGYHLGRIYEKLGINSRAQLAARIGSRLPGAS